MECSPGKQVEFAVSRFDQIFMSDRFGADAAPAPAPAAGPPPADPAAAQVASAGISAGAGLASAALGGGAGGMGASISIDPAAIIQQVTGAAEAGQTVENNPTVYFRKLNDKLRKRMGQVKRLNDSLSAKNRYIGKRKQKIAGIKAKGRQRRRNLRNWINNPKRKFTWGPLKGKYKDPLAIQIARNERAFIKKHGVKSIDKIRLDFWKEDIRRVTQEARRNWTSPKRNDLLKHWQDAMNIETMKPILSGKPEGFALMQMASTGFALTPTNLKVVFPDKRKYPHITGIEAIVEAKEAHKGVVPATFRNPAATSVINLFSQGYIAGTDAAPNWLLGIPPKANSAGGLSLDVTPVKKVFLAMYTDPTERAEALASRTQRLIDAGVIAGERDAGRIETVSEAVTNIRAGEQGGGAYVPPSVPYSGPAYEPLPPAQPAYDPYAAYPPYDPYAPQAYDPYAPPGGYYPPQGQQNYYSQPQYPQSGYYPPQQPAMAGFHWRVPNVRR